MEVIKTFFLHQAEAPNQSSLEVLGNWAFTPVCWLMATAVYTLLMKRERPRAAA